MISKDKHGDLIVHHFGATCHISDRGTHMYVSSVYCPKRLRGRGLGKGLMREVLNFARKMCVQYVGLGVGPFGDATMTYEQTMNFYKKLGFVQEGISCRMKCSTA